MVWLLIMLVETVHGVLRGLLLVPRVGEEAAQRIGWPAGLLIVLLVSVLTIRWTQIRDTRSLLVLGTIWAILTLAFEAMIGLLRGFDAGRILAELNPASGLMVYSAAAMLLAPLAAARLRRVS